MKRTAENLRIMWIISAVLLAAGIHFTRDVNLDMNSRVGENITGTTQFNEYPGPSEDYAVTPHPWSFTYSGPDSSQHLLDVDRYRRWEEDVKKDGLATAHE